MLIRDIPNDLFDQVLKRDERSSAAVLVLHDRQVLAQAAHLGESAQHDLRPRERGDRPGDGHGVMRGSGATLLADQEQMPHGIQPLFDEPLYQVTPNELPPAGVNTLPERVAFQELWID